MGSRPARDSDSPSATSFLLPQLRHSRRGSIASLSSVNQIDKETLSQALDEIHLTASRTDTLTTFNEYTSPPSSSSGLDSKGIATELQGGISGLYNRFRASVGNAKDTLNAGGEDDTADRVSMTSLSKSSPTPSTKGTIQPTRAVTQATAAGKEHARSESGRQSPFASSSVKSSITESVTGGRQSSSQAQPEAITASVLAPPKVSQALGPDGRGSASSESKIESSLPGGPDSGDVATPSGTSGKDESSQSRKGPPERFTTLKQSESSATKVSVVEQTGDGFGAAPASPIGDRKSEEDGNRDLRSSERRVYPSSPKARTQFSKTQSSSEAVLDSTELTTSSLKRLSLDVDEDRENASDPTGRIERDSSIPYNEISRSVAAIAHDRKGKPQHLELPARKSMAPPLVSGTQSPGPRLSRASSTDTNTDSLASAPRTLAHRQGLSGLKDGIKTPKQTLPVGQAALQRDPRMMNVFSQARNKILSKEYWMKDENARDCFNCGEPFSTFRRKHHCREFQPGITSSINYIRY